MTSLYLIRHGESFANTKRVVGGMRGDTGLTPLGVAQAERLRDRLAGTGEIEADVLIASTLPRARQTAEILAPALGLLPLLDDEVQELRPGEADGMSLEEAATKYTIPNFELEPFRPICPGSESFSKFMYRVCAALDRITREHEDRTVVVVTHGGFIDGSFLHFFGMNPLAAPATQFATRYTSITRWQRRRRWNGSEGWHLAVYNDSAHLFDLDRAARIPWESLRKRPAGGESPPASPIPTEPAS